MNRVSPKPNRREVFVSALRCTALGVVAAAGGLTLIKRRRLVEEGVCINSGMCQGCVVLADCGLPAAMSMKDVQQKGDHGRAK